jgi:serpentine type 7TM GPCR chemoreceptor Srw
MALKAIACVNILALIVAIPMFVEGIFHPIPVRSLLDRTKIIDACVVRDYSEDPRFSTLYSVYSVVRALLINVGPCTILVILNAILVERMKEAKQNRDKLIRRRSYEVRAQEQTNVTLMLVCNKRI